MNKLFKRSGKQEKAPSRITNDTILEHREQVLAGGRKFKYPLQYAKHKLVINTIIIAIVALVLAALFGWWQLYLRQDTSTFSYRVTAVLGLPAATVDGASVRYSDYLLRFRGSEHVLKQKQQLAADRDDMARQLTFLKQRAMNEVITEAYAAKVAEEKGISVTDQELDQYIARQRQTAMGEVTERTYLAAVYDQLGWDAGEYREVMRAKLLLHRVKFAVEESAKDTALRAKELVDTSGVSWAELVVTLRASSPSVEYIESGMVFHANQDDGLAAAAMAMEVGKVSNIIESKTGAGYYIVRTLDKTDTRVGYEAIKVPLSTFDALMKKLRDDQKVHMYIAIPNEEEVQSNAN